MPAQQPMEFDPRDVVVGVDVLTTAGSDEDDVAVWITGDRPAVGVEEPVVEAAQRDEIVGLGGATVGPMDHVVDVHPTGAVTPRKPTSLVS